MNLDDLFGSEPVAEAVPVEPRECPPPGVYYGVPAAIYHGWPAISSTLLKAYDKLPSTVRKPFVVSDDMAVGSGIHAYSLQGQAGLDEECHFGPAFGKGKADLTAKAELQAEHRFKTVLPAYYGSPAPGLPVMEILQGVDSSLRSHPKVGPVLAESQKEVSVVWVDPDTGCHCKARFDIWDGSVIWDLKKARSVDGFQWQIKDLGYIIQAGFYYDGALANKLPAVGFGFIPCEAGPPFLVSCGYVDPDKLEAARMNARRLIGLVKQSQITGIWPNYRIPDHIFNLDDITPDDLVNVY